MKRENWRVVFKRSSENPILEKDPLLVHERKVLNPSIIKNGDGYLMCFRQVNNDHVSAIGIALSTDGEHFSRMEKPALMRGPKRGIDEGGVEDPRIIRKEDGVFVMTYTAVTGHCAKLSIATSVDGYHWEKKGLAFKHWDNGKAGGFKTWGKPGEKLPTNWTKSGAIIPKKTGDNYWMAFGDSCIWKAESADAVRWRAKGGVDPFLKPRENFFDEYFLEAGPSPVDTPYGWLFLYEGIDHRKNYRVGYVLLDRVDPDKIIFRAKYPIFWAEETYELVGEVDVAKDIKSLRLTKDQEQRHVLLKSLLKKGELPEVVFCSGVLLEGDVVRIYYGAADTVICTAEAKLSDVLWEYLKG